MLVRMRTVIVFLIGITMFCITLTGFHYSGIKEPGIWALILVVSSGFLGASFSMLTGLKNQIELNQINELMVAHRLTYLLMRPFVGVGAALILYFFLWSGNAEQMFFSTLVYEGELNIKDTYKAFSWIIVWSFAAGFSEKMIPRILDRKVNSRL